MPFHQWSISEPLTLSKSIYYAYFHSIIKYGIIFWVTLPPVGRFSLCKRKSSEFMAGEHPQPHVEIYLNN
jgi:hypothetical protein